MYSFIKYFLFLTFSIVFISSCLATNVSAQAGLPAPTNLQANPVGTSAPDSLQVSWDQVSDATDYNIVWEEVPTVSGALPFSAFSPTSPYIISGLTPGKRYHVIVKAFGSAGISPNYVEGNYDLSTPGTGGSTTGTTTGGNTGIGTTGAPVDLLGGLNQILNNNGTAGSANPLNSKKGLIGPTDQLGTVVSGFLYLFFGIAGFLLFIWMTWGIFQYIFSGGDKNKLAQARGRITWSIVGFVIIVMSFALSKFAQEVLKPKLDQNLPSVSMPTETSTGTGGGTTSTNPSYIAISNVFGSPNKLNCGGAITFQIDHPAGSTQYNLVFNKSGVPGLGGDKFSGGAYHINLNGSDINIDLPNEVADNAQNTLTFNIAADSSNAALFTGADTKTLVLYDTPSGSATTSVCSVPYTLVNPADRYNP